MESIIKTFFYNIILILSLFLPSVSIADKAEYQIGVGFMAFNYAEYLDNNDFLDGETGFIPGLVLKRKQNHQGLFTELVGKFSGSIIAYDGQTQGGIPVKTNSIAIVVDTHFKLGMKLAENHEPYIGLGYRYWYRNILNGRDIYGNAVAGLLEEYYWPYALLGYGAAFYETGKIKVGFDMRVTQMLNAKMDINFLGFKGYDNSRVNLGNKLGLRFDMPVQIKKGKNSLTVTPYYEIIDIGKSNLVVITQAGIPVTGCSPDPCQLYEPRSETRNVGIEVTWIW